MVGCCVDTCEGHRYNQNRPLQISFEYDPIFQAVHTKHLILKERLAKGETLENALRRVENPLLQTARSLGVKDRVKTVSTTSLPTWEMIYNSLVALDISNCQLGRVPVEIMQLTSLNQLYLANLRISKPTVGPQSPRSPRLQPQRSVLRLSDSRSRDRSSPSLLSELQPVLSSLPHLTELDLSRNNLFYNSFPPDFFASLKHLSVLSLANNHLNLMPKDVFQLAKLKSLNLNSSTIVVLDERIAQLTTLESLDIGNNAITALPISMNKLTKLKRLNISSTVISSLDDNVDLLGKLDELQIRYTPLFMKLPPGVNKSDKQILQYLKDLLAASIRWKQCVS